MSQTTTIPDPLARRAASHPDRLALLAAATPWSFGELNRAASELAGRLLGLGIQPGHRVALLAGNTPTFVAMVHAAPRCGAVLVLLNTRLAAAELAFQLADCEATLLLYDPPHAALASQLPQLPLGIIAIDELPAAPADLALRDEIDLDAPHTIIYTSGTTGQPKGAVLSYGNHWWSATASALNLGLCDDDRWLAVLPLFHVGGLSILLRGAIYGMPIVLQERFAPATTNEAIAANGVTIVSLVATMLQRMLDAKGEQPFPPHLRCVLLGGGPAPLPLLEQCAARGLPVVQTYGLTESASQAVTLAPTEALRRLGSAGQALLPISLRIDTAGHAAAPGEVGEILLRGPMITAGYINRPQATAEALRAGWLHTGDLGYLDADGYLYVVDRRSDLIISGGENIYPAEVEAALLAHAAVAEAGVVGRPDAQWGQVPIAIVVLRSPASEAEILAWLRERLAAYKLPRKIVAVDELPRTASGKIRRALLRAFA